MGPVLLGYITGELNESLSGGIISRVHQPDERDIVLRVFVRGHDEHLLISTHPAHPRMHVTEEGFTNPPAPKRFCAYLRSRITNAVIEGFYHKEGERIVRIALKKRTDGYEDAYTLVAELTGKSSNVILVDKDGMICDALRYFPPDASLRAVEPGLRLESLPPAKPAEKGDGIIPQKKDGMSWNKTADEFYSKAVGAEGFTLELNRLRRAVNEARKKAQRKLDNLLGDKTRATAELGYSKTGDLVIINMGRLKRGMKEFTADDYTEVPPKKVTVALDEKLSPHQNAEKYFKRSKKAKHALEMLASRIPAVEEEIEYLSTAAYELDGASVRDDLDEIEEELAQGGYIRKMPAQTSKQSEDASRTEPIRRFTSSEGFEILCGKSGTGNDLIVKKHARDEDVWFHAAKVPGSHVLIKVAGRGGELTKKTIEEAASLAAGYSKNQFALKAEVIYTEARNVKKPRGAKPGMVTVKEYKSISVKPGRTLGGKD